MRVELRAGTNPPLALTLAPGAVSASEKQGFGEGDGFSRRTQYLIAGGLGLAALLIINEINDDDSESAPSVFKPTE